MPKKANIPKAIREQCWIEVFGKSFEHKCYIPWCKNIINVFIHESFGYFASLSIMSCFMIKNKRQNTK